MVLQAAIGDGLSFDPFPFDEDGVASSEVDVSRGEILEALVVAAMVVVLDEGTNLARAGWVPWRGTPSAALITM